MSFNISPDRIIVFTNMLSVALLFGMAVSLHDKLGVAAKQRFGVVYNPASDPTKHFK